MSAQLARLEEIIDTSSASARIEALLPVGVRPRQLKVRTLLLGMLLVAVEGRPAHLRRVHQALLALAERERFRLGVTCNWNTGPHQLTYRQVEYTVRRVVKALSKQTPDGSPSQILSEILDRLLQASITVLGEPSSSSYAVDWTDQETWSRPPPKKPEDPDGTEPTSAEDTDPTDNAHAGEDTEPAGDHAEQPDPERDCADPEAAWGHRRGTAPGQKDETFYGYYLQTVTSVKDEHGPEVPELARRIHLASCENDPPPALVPVLQRMAASGTKLGDILADSGYSYRVAERWALPVRALGAELIQDLHPNDRGAHGTHQGATCHNGNLYCPATPTTLLEHGPLPRAATTEQTQAHDRLSAELSRYKLSPLTAHDQDGYHRVTCPATTSKLRKAPPD